MNRCRPECCQSDDDRELLHVCYELRRGREAAADLLGLIRQQKCLSAANENSLDPALGLAARVLDSFSNSLSMLGYQDPAAGGGGANWSNKRSSSSSGGRKCHKPRKTDSWIEVTSALIADGYAWRKYGQKPILNAKHPRSYFRCTSKPDCQALKRVQKMDDDDDRPMYEITHIGRHTCQDPSNVVVNDKDSSIFLNFETWERNNSEQSNSSEGLGTLSSEFKTVREVNKEHQAGSSSTPLSENAEIETSPLSEIVQWRFDDFDYLIGSWEFNDDAF